MSALHARRTRLLAELNERAVEVGAAHVAIDPRAEPSAVLSEAREATLRAELGARLIVSEIAVASRQSESTVRVQLDEATRLARLPRALDALDDGLLSPAHARALADGVFDLREGSLAEFEDLTLPSALRGTPAQVRRRARAVRERLHPLSIEIRAARRRAERPFSFEADRDGMAWLHLHLPCADARGAFERVDSAARSLAAAPGETRGIGQIRADVAGDLLLYGDVDISSGDEPGDDEARGDEASVGGARGARTSGSDARPIGGGVGSRGSNRVAGRHLSGRRGRYADFRPTVRVTVPVLTLLGRSDEPAVLDGYGPIPTALAEDLVASSPSFTRILTHPETGAVLSVGRTSYAVPADLRRFVQLRDIRCRFAGCERGADRCDIDHTRSWEHGGATSHDNLACLCRAHHRLKHRSTWQVSRPPGATPDLVWTSPFGRVVSDSPDPPF